MIERTQDLPLTPVPPVVQSPTAAIANAVVGVMHRYTGRGPTRARAVIAGDTIVVTLRDALTKAERTLARNGRAGDARAMRRALHDTMRADLVAAIEGLTGRTVEALLGDSLAEPDVAVAVFLLHPQADGAV